MATYTVRVKNTEIDWKADLKTFDTYEEAAELVAVSNNNAKENNLPFRFSIKGNYNSREATINRLIQSTVSEWICGLENQMMDNAPDTEEYKSAKEMLNHDTLFDCFYSDIIADTQNNMQSHIRFAGKKFIEQRIEAALKKFGYGKEN